MHEFFLFLCLLLIYLKCYFYCYVFSSEHKKGRLAKHAHWKRYVPILLINFIRPLLKDKRVVGFDVSTCIWEYSIRVHEVYLLLFLFLIYFKCCFLLLFFFNSRYLIRSLWNDAVWNGYVPISIVFIFSYNKVKAQETGGIWHIYLEFCISVHDFFNFFAYFWFIWNVILISISWFKELEREFGEKHKQVELCTNSN